MSIGNNIRSRRQEMLWSQEELGLKVGVTQEMISQIEKGTKLPSLVLGAAIANAFGCSVDDLLKTKKEDDDAETENKGS